jgi:hypothetical protein
MSKRRSPINPPDRDDCLLATHPSDHNAVYVDAVTHKGREKRLSKTQKRKARDLERFKQGKLNEQVYNRGLGHNAAFLVPVPLYFGYGIAGAACAGGAGGFGAGCATVSSFATHSLCLCFLMVSFNRALVDVAVVLVAVLVGDVEVVLDVAAAADVEEEEGVEEVVDVEEEEEDVAVSILWMLSLTCMLMGLIRGKLIVI